MADKWMNELMDAVSNCWQWHALALNIGFRYREPEDADDCREIWAYPAVQENVGGKDEGKTGWSGFHFNLSVLLEEVEAEALSVSTRMANDPPEIIVEGKFRGQAVHLHVCLEPPEDVEATEIIDLTRPEGPSVSEKG
jgi:hypothetical protein